jgi:hypothetical protein
VTGTTRTDTATLLRSASVQLNQQQPSMTSRARSTTGTFTTSSYTGDADTTDTTMEDQSATAREKQIPQDIEVSKSCNFVMISVFWIAILLVLQNRDASQGRNKYLLRDFEPGLERGEDGYEASLALFYFLEPLSGWVAVKTNLLIFSRRERGSRTTECWTVTRVCCVVVFLKCFCE